MATAIEQVFATTELLEQILSYSSMEHLFGVQRVSTAFKGTIEGSAVLQRAMFLMASKDETKMHTYAELHDWFIHASTITTHVGFLEINELDLRTQPVAIEADWTKGSTPHGTGCEPSWRKQRLAAVDMPINFRVWLGGSFRSPMISFVMQGSETLESLVSLVNWYGEEVRSRETTRRYDHVERYSGRAIRCHFGWL